MNYLMEYVSVVNLACCAIVMLLCIKKYRQTRAKAFIFIMFGFFMQSISHFSILMGWGPLLQPTLIATRITGYTLIIIGMLV